MFEVGRFLDRAKACSGLTSDYSLAKRLHVLPSRISNWRRGENVPDERAIIRLCELAREDPDFTIAAIQALRSPNDDARRAWTKIANRLRAETLAKFAAVFALVLVAQFFGGTDAAATLALPAGSLDFLYIVLICLCVALATPRGLRLARMLAQRAAHAYKSRAR